MFINAGRVYNALPGVNFSGEKVEVAADGSFVVTGTATAVVDGVTQWYVAAMRYLNTGMLDSSFGGDGIVYAAPALLVPTVIAGSGVETIKAGGTLQADGKIVLAATAQLSGNVQGVILTRYNPDGSLDTSFGNNGKVESILPNGVYGATELMQQPDGKLVLAGFGVGMRSSFDFAIMRFNEDGSADQDFYDGVPLALDFTPGVQNGSTDVVYGMDLQADGKILIVGKSMATGATENTALLRLTADGFPDFGFGSEGIVKTTVLSPAETSAGRDIIALDNGKVLVIGNAVSGSTKVATLLRYNSDGSYDNTFGSFGAKVLGTVGGLQVEFATAQKLANGHVLVAGTVGDSFAIFDLDGNGDIANFQTVTGGSGAKVQSVAVQPDGKILLVGDGGVMVAGTPQGPFLVWRFNADFTVDQDFYNTLDFDHSYTLGATEQHLVLTGSNAIDGTGNALNNYITGNGAANVLDGGDGNDVLDGGAGDDTLIGGNGDDIYLVDSSADVIVDNGSGTDLVKANASYTLSEGLDNLALLNGAIAGTGNSGDNLLTGNSSANVLSGGAGNDTLEGGLGADTMQGGEGSDLYAVDNAGDIVTDSGSAGDSDTVRSSISYTLGADIENLILTTASRTGTGNALANVLTGSAGTDTLIGGLGNDTYVVNSSLDKVTETSSLASEIDTVLSSATYVLSANVENLTLTGSLAINATGNTLNNVLTGNDADNTLDGSTGADTMAGGAGTDWYYVDNVGDVVIEAANDPARPDNDTVWVGFNYTLGANVEGLILTGVTAVSGTGNELNNSMLGNSLANVLDGGLGDDNLIGGVGADTMIGGIGNDTYTVDNIGDVIVDTSDPYEIELVKSSISYVLAANLEHLTLTGAAAINATGNAGNNALTGNAGANILDGAGGADTLAGGAGNDTYLVDDIGDVVTETSTVATEIDLVQSSVDFSLGANIENLTLGGSAVNGNGNGLANTILGNLMNNVLTGGLGNDTLNGGTGADTMDGGAGSDVYYVDDAGDTIIEGLNGGADGVLAAISYTLGSNIENATLTGAANIDLTGNELANNISGNTGNNVVDGGIGNDTVNGGSGNDLLLGGAGADVLSGGNGNDTLIGGTGIDTLVGGLNTDVFRIEQEVWAGGILGDTISDFKVAEGDKIDLSAFDADSATAGRQALTWVTTFTAPGQVRFSGGNLVINTDDSAQAGEYVITLTGVTSLTAASLIL